MNTWQNITPTHARCRRRSRQKVITCVDFECMLSRSTLITLLYEAWSRERLYRCRDRSPGACYKCRLQRRWETRYSSSACVQWTIWVIIFICCDTFAVLVNPHELPGTFDLRLRRVQLLAVVARVNLVMFFVQKYTTNDSTWETFAVNTQTYQNRTTNFETNRRPFSSDCSVWPRSMCTSIGQMCDICGSYT